MYMCVIDLVSLYVYSIGFRICLFSVGVRVAHPFSFMCCLNTFLVQYCDVRYDFCIKR